MGTFTRENFLSFSAKSREFLLFADTKDDNAHQIISLSFTTNIYYGRISSVCFCLPELVHVFLGGFLRSLALVV